MRLCGSVCSSLCHFGGHHFGWPAIVVLAVLAARTQARSELLKPILNREILEALQGDRRDAECKPCPIGSPHWRVVRLGHLTADRMWRTGGHTAGSARAAR